MNRIDKSQIISSCINMVGKECIIRHSNGLEDSIFAVLQPVWRRAKSRFEGVRSPIGEVQNDYYIFIGPCDYDITALSKDDTLICDGKRFYFERSEKVKVSNISHYCTGVLKRVYGEDEYEH